MLMRLTSDNVMLVFPSSAPLMLPILVACILHPVIFGIQRISSIVRSKPVIHASSVPQVHHNFTRCLRNVRCGRMFQNTVDIPLDITGLPIESIRMKALGRIKAQIDDFFMTADAVRVIIELHFRRVFSQKFNINLKPSAFCHVLGLWYVRGSQNT